RQHRDIVLQGHVNDLILCLNVNVCRGDNQLIHSEFFDNASEVSGTVYFQPVNRFSYFLFVVVYVCHDDFLGSEIVLEGSFYSNAEIAGPVDYRILATVSGGFGILKENLNARSIGSESRESEKCINDN